MPVTRELSVRAELLEEGGPPLWEAFMDELREAHLGLPRDPANPSVMEQLRQAYLEALPRTEQA
jgi:hypothetical protein